MTSLSARGAQMSSPFLCIYCASVGPFSDEHVVCAGLGGDDNRFLLKGVVCAHCNTNVFAPLEREVLRSSPLAIARSFMQPTSRKRGKRTSTPKLDAQMKVMIDEDGYPAEVELGQHGQPITSPQLIMISLTELKSKAVCEEDLATLADDLARMMEQPELICVRKTNSATRRFEISTYRRDCQHFAESAPSQHLDKPPKGALWLTDNPLGRDQPCPLANLHRANENLVLKLGNIELASALTFFYLVSQQIELNGNESKVVRNPLVSVRMSVRIGATERVIAKIGLNILAFHLGADFVGQAGFNETKRAILTGTPALRMHSVEAPEHKQLLAFAPPDHHGFLLTCVPLYDGRLHVVLTCLLYGTYSMMDLGTVEARPQERFPFAVTVDYLTHRVELLDLGKLFAPERWGQPA